MCGFWFGAKAARATKHAAYMCEKACGPVLAWRLMVGAMPPGIWFHMRTKRKVSRVLLGDHSVAGGRNEFEAWLADGVEQGDRFTT